MQGLPRRARLRRPGEFRAVLSGGRRVEEARLTAVLKAATAGRARLGLAISSRVAPRAVDRNRIKRAARESFRRHRGQLPPLDVVILARSGAAQQEAGELRASFARLWQKILRDNTGR